MGHKVSPPRFKLKVTVKNFNDYILLFNLNKSNLEGHTAYYSDDAQSMSPNKPTMVGKAAILADVQAEMDKDTSSNSTIKFEIVDLYAEGDLLVEVGKSITNKADGTETYGKYVSIFKK